MLAALLPTLSWLGGLAATLFSVATALHALFRKRSPRTAAAWVGVCLVFPLFGALAYWVFGQNRIFYRARRLRRRWPPREELDADLEASRADLERVARSEEEFRQFREIARVCDAATGLPLVAGNTVALLENGDACYPRMLAAIGRARETVFLETYLFDGPRVEALFGEALARAVERKVDVRILLDGLGSLVDRNTTRHALERRGIRVATFLSPSLDNRGLHINLRNHRKILTVDGTVGFTGGMNLRDVNFGGGNAKGWFVRDLHFELEGPIVRALELVFLEDWTFATGEEHDLGVPRPSDDAARPGNALCRAIPDGPNEDFESFKWALIGAIGSARRRVRIVSPYFIPTEDLETALVAASLRGVVVQVLMPATVDHRVTQWATRAMLWQLLDRGVEIRLQPGPFVHSKLVLIDDVVALVGSANLDPRSLLLNFEFNLVVHDPALAQELDALFERDWAPADRLTLEELTGAPLWQRFRNNVARLGAPYL